MSIFTDDMKVYVENSKGFTKKQNLHEINIRIQDSIHQLYFYILVVSNPKMKFEGLFTITSKMKILWKKVNKRRTRLA